MLLSSLAESVYWFARYIERSESIARMILVHDSLLLDIPPHCNPGWAPLVNISGGCDTFYRCYDGASERNVVHYLLALRYFAAREESPAVSNDPGTAARAIAECQPPPGEIATVREAITSR